MRVHTELLLSIARAYFCACCKKFIVYMHEIVNSNPRIRISSFFPSFFFSHFVFNVLLYFCCFYFCFTLRWMTDCLNGVYAYLIRIPTFNSWFHVHVWLKMKWCHLSANLLDCRQMSVLFWLWSYNIVRGMHVIWYDDVDIWYDALLSDD